MTKWGDTISKIQVIGNSTGKMTSLFKTVLREGWWKGERERDVMFQIVF